MKTLLVLGATVALLILLSYGLFQQDRPVPSRAVPPPVGASSSSDVADFAGQRITSGEPGTRTPIVEHPTSASEQGAAVNDFHTLLYAGLLSREEVGDEKYTRLIREKAKSRTTSLTQEEREGFMARLCGFHSIDALQAAMSSANPDHPEAPIIARQMAEEAEMAADDFAAAMPDAWDRGSFMEWDPKAEEPSVADWLTEHGKSFAGSEIRRTSSTRAGDRCYRLMFLSEDYPFLESRIREIKRLRKELRGL